MKAHLEYLKFKASYSKFTTAADAIAVLAGHVLLLAKHSRQCSLWRRRFHVFPIFFVAPGAGRR